ncbi:bifunctional pyr operon transcriptional regulator/uracil phosphoribosyltransferase PyrR [uncultured Veillonella sp.]|uniref:bifunctional pyr operon transcriptional regulator/uracil phosphoribosyltransferase PyrR n=2 Tax=uncultured Veillonella sp. TaxID=159268 RepID=UPI0025FFA098|nr:bifunctional pyr operon transcriptional regulator/uracil phosphoribosyltransferase PyrR [uncultured Veillonella sp.]MDY3974790.1 bifunctional pyr operon transcriptional regulator/uracil phosphoribosyltransferase PyrR [Veillonella caviae]
MMANKTKELGRDGDSRILMDEQAMMRAVRRISHEILERNKGLENALIIGIERRGVYLAHRLQKQIEAIEGTSIEVGTMNVALYRDDRNTKVKEGTPFTIDTTGKLVILVDDVLYTGRTIRAALNALMEVGRPRAIQLAVLVDRGHRELPIRADYVGKNIPTSHAETVRVNVVEQDGIDSVTIS